jgi:ribosome-associated toxin RatA of RatAB toxin-antitoxin module
MIARALTVGALTLGMPYTALAEFDWQPGAAQHAQLARGGVVVDVPSYDDLPLGSVRAAISIPAASTAIYSAMTSCAEALRYVPRLTFCHVRETAADRSTQLIEHVVDYGWYLPAQRYTFRAHYTPTQRIAFELVSGDLRELRGVWTLTPNATGTATIVTYEVRIQPKARVPRWLVRRSLKRELPALLTALRAHVNVQAKIAGVDRG